MQKNVKIIIILGVIIAVIAFLSIYYHINTIPAGGNPPPHYSLFFSQSNETDTLTITDLSTYYPDKKYYWSDVEVISGNATLPTGVINEGDVITDCSGMVQLKSNKFNRLLGTWTFS